MKEHYYYCNFEDDFPVIIKSLKPASEINFSIHGLKFIKEISEMEMLNEKVMKMRLHDPTER